MKSPSVNLNRSHNYHCSACTGPHRHPAVRSVRIGAKWCHLCGPCAQVSLAQAHLPGDALVEYEPATRRTGARWLVLVCPFCLRRHRHPAGESKDDPRTQLGRRVALCRRGSGGVYNLVCLDLEILVPTNRSGNSGGSA